MTVFFTMRTTVELSDETRARLLELAARRGEKGFSSIVEEAVRRYLDDEADRRELVERALDTLGTLSDEDAEHLHETVRSLRDGPWR